MRDAIRTLATEVMRRPTTCMREPLEIQIGPSHPATHGTVRISLELDGETHRPRATSQVGYLHRGFEKECESGFYYQAIPYTDRLNYASPMINNVGYCLAVEKLFGVEMPPRCQFIRVIASELSRIARSPHVPRRERPRARRHDAVPLRHGGARADLGPGRRAVRRAGHQQLRPHRRPAERSAGRLRRALPRQTRRRRSSCFADIEGLLTENPIFRERMEGTGALPRRS